MTRGALSVEFLGVPGAGKSGVSRRAAAIIRNSGIPVVETAYDLTHESGVLARRWRKSAYVARELLVHPGYSWRSLRAIKATRQATASDHFGASWNWLFVSNLLRSGGRMSGIHMLDEGIFQALWSVGFGAEAGGLRDVFYGVGPWVPLPEVVVIVNARLPTVEQRLRSRGVKQSRIEDRLDIDGGVLAKSEQLIGEIRELLGALAREGRNVRVHEMSNEREPDLEQNAHALAGILTPMIEGRP